MGNYGLIVVSFFLSSRRRHTIFALVSWARRCGLETAIAVDTEAKNNAVKNRLGMLAFLTACIG